MSSNVASERRVTVALLGSRGIPALYGGFETVVMELANSLPKDRFRLYVACESSLRRLGPSLGSVRLVYFPVSERFRILSEVAYDALSLAWSAVADIDVVLIFGYAASVFCLLPRLFGKPVIVNVDGLEWKRKKFPRFAQLLLKIAEEFATLVATELVCDSRAIALYYRERYHTNPIYIPNPAVPCACEASETLREFGLDVGQYYCVVARLEPENNIRLIIEGFKKSNSAKRLVIVGPLLPTRYVKELMQLRNKKVLFLGGIYERDRLTAIRKNCFAYVHGHEVGGTNPSLLEAMSCGNPILALDVPFNREVSKGAALYFTNEAELAGNIRILETNPEKRGEMGRAAQVIASQEYSAADIVRQYAGLLSTVDAVYRPQDHRPHIRHR